MGGQRGVAACTSRLPTSALAVSFRRAAGRSRNTKGGADTALENNNVYALEPKAYVEGTDPSDPMNLEAAGAGTTMAANAATIIVSFVGVGILAVGGTAFFIFYENLGEFERCTSREQVGGTPADGGALPLPAVGLGIFWVVLFGIVAAYIYQTVIKKQNL